MTVGIVMAGGKGKRFAAKGTNKTAELFGNKPIVKYGTDLFSETTDKVVVVVGVEAESVKKAVGRNGKVVYAYQKTPRGTGDALRAAMEKIRSLRWKPEVILIGNGDHMMFYDRGIVKEMIEKLKKEKAGIVMLTTEFAEPDKLAWGRVVRNKQGFVVRIVEHKDATERERRITEQNANFFAYDHDFAEGNYRKLKPSPVSGEYYITDMVELAVGTGRKVVAIKLPFERVGIGINTRKELSESVRLYRSLGHSPNE